MRHVFYDKETAVMKDAVQPFLDDHTIVVTVHYFFTNVGVQNKPCTHEIGEDMFTNIPRKIKKIVQFASYKNETNVPDMYDAGTRSSRKESTPQANINAYSRICWECVMYEGKREASCSGRVIAIGRQVRSVSVGDWVACLGMGYARYADLICVTDQDIVRLDSREHIRTASMIAPAVSALQGIKKARLSLGDRVAIFGLDTVGLFMVQFAKMAGCTVIAIDSNIERLTRAKKGGADYIYQLEEYVKSRKEAPLVGTFKSTFDNADVSIIAGVSKQKSVVRHAIETTRIKGRLVVMGEPAPEIDFLSCYKKHIESDFFCEWKPDSRDSAVCIRDTKTKSTNMYTFVDLIRHDAINMSMMVSAEQPIIAINRSLNHDNYDRAVSATHKSPHVTVRFTPVIRKTRRVGFIGVGMHAKSQLFSRLTNTTGIHIQALIDCDAQGSTIAFDAHGISHTCIALKDVFMRGDLDVIVLAAPHLVQSKHVLHALRQGKAVFVEKPLATTTDQLSQWRTFLSVNSHVPLCVNYNYSYAPFVQRIKEIVTKRNTPLTIIYRMNTGLTMSTRRAYTEYTEYNVGTILGDASAIIDLFCFLTDARPVAVSVETMGASQSAIRVPTDNFSAHIRFDDGSVCTLVYTSVGHPDMGQERMEVFADGKTMVIDDYLRLSGFGVPLSFGQMVLERDKGERALIKSFFERLEQEEFVPPISFDRILTVTELSLVIDNLVCQGGGDSQLSG